MKHHLLQWLKKHPWGNKILGLLMALGLSIPIYETDVIWHIGTGVMELISSEEQAKLPPMQPILQLPEGISSDSADFYQALKQIDTLEAVYRASDSGHPTDLKRNRKPEGKRIGAVCRDGSVSESTGRGACSNHGGVDHWLYAEDYANAQSFYEERQRATYESPAAPPKEAREPFELFWHFCLAVLASIILLALIRKAL